MNTNIKKILALVLVVVLTASITLGVTLALLTDETEIKHNVFTAGKVKVELTETVDGDTYGGVTSDANGGNYNLVAPGDDLTKEVKVANTGNIPAYVAVTVTMNNADKINAAIDDFYEAQGYSAEKIQAIYNHVFENWGLNYTKTDRNGLPAGMSLTISGSDMPAHTLQVDSVKTIDEYWLTYTQNWFGHDDADTVIPFDGYYTEGMEAYELKWTYYLYMEPGEESVLFTGINVPDYFVNEQMAMFDGLEIDIQGAAIQAENFADAKAAFTALRGEQKGTNTTVIPVSDPKDLVAMTKSGENVQMTKDMTVPAEESNAYGKTGLNVFGGVLDGNGKTLSVPASNGTWDSAVNITAGTIKNVTIDKGFRGIFVNHNNAVTGPVILENVIIDGPVYTISCDQGTNSGLVATNSTFNGWTSYAATIGDVKFTDCSFGEGSGYAYCRPFAPTTFVGCDFEAGYVMEARAAVTFENCTLDGQPLTAANLGTLVISGIANATVK